MPKVSFKTSQFPIFLMLTICSGIFTSPKVWMSEYSYSLETMDTFEILTFPVHPSNKLLNNSFIFQPNYSQVFVVGNLSHLVFTCEATDYPVYWTVSQNINQASTPITLLTYNILKPAPVSIQTNSSKTFTSLMTIFMGNPQDNLFPNQHGNWLFTCHDGNGNHGNLKTANITLKFGKPPKNFNKPEVLKNKIGIAILTQKSPATMATANKNYLNLANILTHQSFNQDSNSDQLSVLTSKNISIDLADFYDNLGYDDDDDSFKLTKTLIELNPNESIAQGDMIQVLCFSSNQFDYAIGSYLEISMETGTQKRRISEEKDENIEGLDGSKRTQVLLSENSVKLAKQLFLMDDYNDHDQDKWLSKAQENMIFFLTEEFTLEKGTNKIECYMPLWSTGKWDKVSTEINVVTK